MREAERRFGAICYDGALIGDPAIVRVGAALITTVAVR
jgi:hypothetical protein